MPTPVFSEYLLLPHRAVASGPRGPAIAGMPFATRDRVCATEAIQKISPGRHYGARSNTLEAYRSLVGDELLAELGSLARELNGVRLCHVNSSAAGGGVAELLAREVPLLEALGIRCDWRVIRADEEFFAITKTFHNALHGSRARLPEDWASTYLRHTKASAEALTGDYDVFVVHDPQPAAICQFRRRGVSAGSGARTSTARRRIPRCGSFSVR